MMRFLVALTLAAFSCANELDDYVHTPDPNYSWEVVNTFRDRLFNTYVGYNLRLVSQRWGEGLVIPEHEIWEHYLTIVVPTNRTAPERGLSLLYMTGGSRNSGPPSPISVDVGLIILLATETGVPAAALFQTPNQPLVYLDDPDRVSRREDVLIAWGWRKFLTEDNPDPEWLARFPMTKAGVAAMDAITEFMDQELDENVDNFVVAGGSKRGWATWTVAAVDDRVTAAIPMVMDELNLRENLRHHQQMLAGWSFAFDPYYNQNITRLLDSPRLDDLTALVDPYSYKERYISSELPIYMISAAGDQFFMPDDSTFFSHEMGPDFRMQMMPNCEHTLALCIPSVARSVGAFIDTFSLPEQSQLPVYSSFIREADGAIVFEPVTRPIAVRIWSATSANSGRKDFRLMKLNEDGSPVAQDVIWRSQAIAPGPDGNYIALLPEVPGRWVGFYMVAEFPGAVDGSGHNQQYTSDVSIIPRTYPVPPCSGEGCFSILV